MPNLQPEVSVLLMAILPHCQISAPIRLEKLQERGIFMLPTSEVNNSVNNFPTSLHQPLSFLLKATLTLLSCLSALQIGSLSAIHSVTFQDHKSPMNLIADDLI